MNSHNMVYGYVYGDESGKFSLACKCCDLRFEQLSQLREHVLETINDPKVPELPVECLAKIFRYLAPNHLANISRVCRKFKAVAEKVFELHFDPGPIQIKFDMICDEDFETVGSVQCNFVCKSQYEIAFPSLIRRLIMPIMFLDVNGGGYYPLFQFIRDNCCKELVSLVLYDMQSPEPSDRRIYGEIAKDQLKHMQHLRVKNVPFESLYDELLQYTVNLKTLNVINGCRGRCKDERYCPHFDGAWTEHTYPELESIYLHTIDNRFDLMPMICRHPKLRNVACNSSATITSIFRSEIKFNNVVLIFLDDFEVFTRFHSDIVEFGRSKKFETFELCLARSLGKNIDQDIIYRIAEIPNLTGLHGGDDILWRRGRVRFPLIEKLCFYYSFFGEDAEDLAQEMNEQFPNLKELRINARNNDWSINGSDEEGHFKLFADAILYDSESFKNLKQLIYENDAKLEFSWDDVVDVNLIRSKRSNPTKITVFVDPEHFHKFDKNVVALPFIEIKPWIYGGCGLCVHCDHSI